MYIIVTGAAGFIGSCIVRMLNDMGYRDIIIVDHISCSEKWKNIRNKTFQEYYDKESFLEDLPKYSGKVSHVIHMGACSSTTEKDFDYLYKNNFDYTRKLWRFCVENNCSFIYASSAATYGSGEMGFDDKSDIKCLIPLNGYGYSKQLFDLWAEKQTEKPAQYVGFKFFNVYGPNEYFKGSMASVVLHAFQQIKDHGYLELFRSYHEKYADGEQVRDFVYVKDLCKVVRFMMENKTVNGLFNLGTGKAESFRRLGECTFQALGLQPDIRYIEMPEYLRGKYQYFTQADMEKLRSVGYWDEFYSLEEGIFDYVRGYLSKDCLIY